MKSNYVKTYLFVLFFSFNCTLLLGNVDYIETKPVSEAEYGIFLNIISSSVQENYEKIETWQGDLELSDTTNYFDTAASHTYREASGLEAASTDRLTKKRTGKASFVVAIKQDKLFSKILCDKPMQYTVPGKPTFSRDKETLWHELCIVTSENYLHFNPLLNYGPSNTLVSDGARGRTAFKDPPEESKSKVLANVIDPRDTFEYGIPIWKELDGINRYLSTKGTLEIDGYKLAIEENDNYIVVNLPGKAGENLYLYKKMVFDVNKGYNIISLEMLHAHDDTVRQRCKWDYENVDGIWVPKSMIRQVFDPKLNELKFERAYSFNVNKLNEPIADDTFTYKNLGLSNGDRLIDNINGIEYTYSEGDLVQANNQMIIEELTTEVIEDMAKNQNVKQTNSLGAVDVLSSQESYIPDEKNALRYEKPYILDLNSGKILYSKNGMDTEKNYHYLLEKQINGIAYKDGKLIVSGNKSYIYKNVAEFEKQIRIDFKQWYSCWNVPSMKEFPVQLFVKANDGKLYRLSILKKEKEGLRVSYDEVKKKISLFQPDPIMLGYCSLNTQDDMNQKDMIISRLFQRGKKAVPVFILSLCSERKGVNLLSAEALGKLDEGTTEVIQALAKSFEQDNNYEAGLSLGRLGKKSKEAVPSLIRIIQNPQHQTDEKALIAIQSLGRIGHLAKEGVPILKRIADSSDLKTRIMIIGALAKIGHETSENTAALKDMLKNEQYQKYRWHINRELNELKKNM